ncbi:MAG: aconitate hydratase, partial [Actinobacteria bacterium]|nr:aconitate hydratase [Actinomycetota bacterium]
LPDWVSAKDVILELLRRHDADGGFGRIVEYHGPGLDSLSCMDRHVICNMGAELGATTSVFPSDQEVKRFLEQQGRGEDWIELVADDDPGYDHTDRIDLSELEPLIALPSNPDNVVPVREVAGRPIGQAYVGSSANPGYRDFAVAAEIVKAAGRQVPEHVSWDINPTSRQILENLARDGHLLSLIASGARLHQAGCNGCIGMGQAPATDTISLRTTPRNFEGRSGTKEDQVYLCSPETATASALTGEITDPRDLEERFGIGYPRITERDDILLNTEMLLAPPEDNEDVEIVKGPNISTIPDFDPLPDELTLPVVLKMGDDISTDHILRAGTEVLPYRSNIPEISKFAFDVVDDTYYDRAMETRESGDGHAVVGGVNYGQGSSREHAAIAPRYLGLRVAFVKEYARIHWQNLANFGVLPLQFVSDDDYDAIDQGDELQLTDLRSQLESGSEIEVENTTKGRTFTMKHTLSPRQVEMVLKGGILNVMKEKLESR